MAKIPNITEGYVKASAYVFLKRKYMAAIVIAAILFICLICAVIIRVRPTGTGAPTGGMPVEVSGGEVSDAEAALRISTQENADLKRRLAELTDDLEKWEREYDGALLLEDALQLGHNNILLNLDDITIKSNAAEYQLNDLLQENWMRGLGWEFLKAEREYGVNAIALIVLTVLQTYVTEEGVEVRDTLQDSSGQTDPLVFETYEDCINYFARILGEEYLNPNGQFFAGKSFVDVYTRFTGDSDEADYAAAGAAELADRLNTTRG